MSDLIFESVHSERHRYHSAF